MKKVISLVVLFIAIVCMLPLQYANAYDVETAWFPAHTMSVYQLAYESASHGEQNAIDILPHGNVFAPFSGTIIYTDPNWGYVVLQSNDKVLWADGSYDYMAVGFMHDNDISDLHVGDTLSQGQEFYQPGGMGWGNPECFGYHVHLEVFRGKPNITYTDGNGEEFAYNAFFVNTDMTTIYADYGERGEGYVATDNQVYNNAPSDYRGLWKYDNGYFNQCEFYPSSGQIEIIKETDIQTYPCATETYSDSVCIRKAKPGEVFNVTGIYLNSAKHYWYRIEIDGQIGYLWPKEADSLDVDWDYATEGVSAPTSLSQGYRFSIQGNITAENCLIERVYGAIRSHNGTNLYYSEEEVNGHSYSLLNSKIDMDLLFNELPVGDYIYTVNIDIMCYEISHDGLSISPRGICTTKLIQQDFTVGQKQ